MKTALIRTLTFTLVALSSSAILSTENNDGYNKGSAQPSMKPSPKPRSSAQQQIEFYQDDAHTTYRGMTVSGATPSTIGHGTGEVRHKITRKTATGTMGKQTMGIEERFVTEQELEDLKEDGSFMRQGWKQVS